MVKHALKFPLSNKVNLADYYTVYAQDCPANAPTLAIVPGVAGGARQFRGALQALGKQFRLVVFTTPGVEGTPVYPGILTTSVLAENVAAVLEKQPEPVLLLGHSMGGFVAQRVAHQWPHLVKKLVLISTSYGRPATQRDVMRLSRTFGHDLMKLNNIQHGKVMDVAHDIRFSEHFRANHANVVESFQQIYAATPLPQAALAQHMTCGAQFSSKNWAHEINQPAFLIHGEEDWIVSSESGHELAEELPHSQWLSVPQCGHFPFIERPEIWQRVSDFWRGATVGGRV